MEKDEKAPKDVPSDEGKEFEENYNKLKKKYDLPELKILNQEFDIEKIANKDSSFILREIRRAMSERIVSYLHLFESFMNPSSTPMYIFSVLKKVEPAKKENMKKIYKRLAKLQLLMLKLDTVYDEEAEANAIKIFLETWEKNNKEIYSIFDELEKKFEKDEDAITRSYLG